MFFSWSFSSTHWGPWPGRILNWWYSTHWCPGSTPPGGPMTSGEGRPSAARSAQFEPGWTQKHPEPSSSAESCHCWGAGYQALSPSNLSELLLYFCFRTFLLTFRPFWSGPLGWLSRLDPLPSASRQDEESYQRDFTKLKLWLNLPLFEIFWDPGSCWIQRWSIHSLLDLPIRGLCLENRLVPLLSLLFVMAWGWEQKVVEGRRGVEHWRVGFFLLLCLQIFQVIVLIVKDELVDSLELIKSLSHIESLINAPVVKTSF